MMRICLEETFNGYTCNVFDYLFNLRNFCTCFPDAGVKRWTVLYQRLYLIFMVVAWLIHYRVQVFIYFHIRSQPIDSLPLHQKETRLKSNVKVKGEVHIWDEPQTLM